MAVCGFTALLVSTPAQAAPALDQCDTQRPSYDEESCFALRAATGRYQEIIDALAGVQLGLKPYQKYFLAIAYFALSGRTGAGSLRCYFTSRAQAQLQSFLVDRQNTFASQQTQESANVAKYTYIAAIALENTRKVAGCEESGETLAALERYGQTYLSAQTEAVFFSYGTDGAKENPVSHSFNDGMGLLQQTIGTFVADVSRMETDFVDYQADLRNAKRYLERLVGDVNGWQADAVVVTDPDDPDVPTYTLGPGMDTLAQDIAGKTSLYSSYVSSDGRRLAELTASVDSVISRAGATNMEAFAGLRKVALDRADAIIEDLRRVSNQTTLILRSEAVAQLDNLRDPPPTGIQALWSSIAQAWNKQPRCKSHPNKAYCP